MKTILVTGGLGFIGSHTVLELISKGFNVVILDNLFNSNIDVLENIYKISGTKPKFYKSDILNINELDLVFNENTFDAVIHFAALKAVGESVEKPLWYYENNVTGTINLLKVMKKYNCSKIVFSSSATVYGTDNIVPFDESMKTSATNPYGYTKLMMEQILLDENTSNPNFTPAILRYFNPIGAHESGLIGENPNGIPNNLLPYIMKVASGELEFLNVFGDDYDTHDGTGIRDYIHVCDLAKGHCLAISHLFQTEKPLLLNLGSGKGSSVLDVVYACEKASGKKIPVKFAKRRAGDIASCYAKTDLAYETIGFKTTKTLDEMCFDSWNYISKNI